MPAHTPSPGRPARGTTTGRPVMVLLDLLGRRWALRAIWELRADTMTFRALQGRMDGVSSSVLSDRLRELGAAGIVERGDEGYRLTSRGHELLAHMEPLQAWAEAWAAGR